MIYLNKISLKSKVVSRDEKTNTNLKKLKVIFICLIKVYNKLSFKINSKAYNKILIKYNLFFDP